MKLKLKIVAIVIEKRTGIQSEGQWVCPDNPSLREISFLLVMGKGSRKEPKF